MRGFPSLSIGANRFVPEGSFAEATAAFLRPHRQTVDELSDLLTTTNTGIVAHFYMDPEIQGVLTATEHPHVSIADSLAMADKAVKMASAGVENIIVLGVDFMSENVRAVLDAAGFTKVNVYRATSEEIGCSLAASADTQTYRNWLQKASTYPNPLHVVYINTSLLTKARAHHLVPTITCTSSNVVRTILAAFAQVEDLDLFYGPDSYMGANIKTLLKSASTWTDAQVATLHPSHTAHSIAALLPHFHTFEHGICVVHHMFGDAVTAKIQRDYPNALLTAHFEVPGEMFSLAAEAALHGRGVVGSTSNILAFISERVRDAIERGEQVPPIILGTEAGMVTSIVHQVQALLRAASSDLTIQIIFPVSDEAVAIDESATTGIIPGVASGEGCSTSGGCASCPYMKLNSLDALFSLLQVIHEKNSSLLTKHFPNAFPELIGKFTAAELGSQPILHMRAFQETSSLPSNLTDAIAAHQTKHRA
jgi:quinolinate synthase